MADYELIALNESVPRLQAATSGDRYVVPAGARLNLPQTDEAATPTLSFGDGNTGFYERIDNEIGVSLGGSRRFYFDASGMWADNAGGPVFLNETASETNPTLVPDRGDTNTGIGRLGGDQLSLIAGGQEGARIEAPALLGATETSLWLYDLDSAVFRQVTVGADDSGGAGFKVLRLPN